MLDSKKKDDSLTEEIKTIVTDIKALINRDIPTILKVAKSLASDENVAGTVIQKYHKEFDCWWDQLFVCFSDAPNLMLTKWEELHPGIKDIKDIAYKIKECEEHVKKSVQGCVDFIVDLAKEYEAWDPEPFKDDLKTLFDKVGEIADELTRIMDAGSLKPGLVEALTKEFLDKFPKIILFCVHKGVDTIPDWTEAPRIILKALKKITLKLKDLASEETGCPLVLDKPDLYEDLKIAKTAAGIMSKALDMLLSLLPKDLSANISIAGEGGGTELMAHPSKLIIQVPKFFIDLCGQIITKYIDFYDSCKQTKWRKDISDRLKSIEEALNIEPVRE